MEEIAAPSKEIQLSTVQDLQETEPGSTICYLESVVDNLESEVANIGYDGEAQFTDGTPACVCTNGARMICERVWGGEVWGYRDEDNPGSLCGEFAGGHDFAVIDGRWIVDYWIKWVACLSDRAVFDLSNADDLESICRIYGNISKWSLTSRPVQITTQRKTK